MNKRWKKRTGSLPALIKNTIDALSSKVIAFKKGDTTNTTELVVYNDQTDGNKHIWKIGEEFNNGYFTIKHYTGIENRYQDTGMYLTANGNDAEPTVKVKQSKKICYLGFHTIN